MRLQISIRHLGVALAITALAACGSTSGPEATTAETTATSAAAATSTTGEAASPDAVAARIVVQAPSASGDGVYLLSSDGALDVQLAPDAGSAKHPDWSPDGATLVFASDSDGSLWTVAADGADPKQLLACDDGCLALDFPAFAPDGRHIAYTRYEPPTGDGPPAASSIRVLDLDSMASTNVVRTMQPQLVDVARWSPDGSELVVGIDVFDADFNEAGSTIGLVNAAGGEIRQLVDPSTFAYAPDWNAATGEIVFSTETLQYRAQPQAGDDTWNLWAIAADGTGQRQITDVAAGQRLFQPSWSPDGTQILATQESAAESSRRTVSIDPMNGTITPVSSVLTTHARLQP